MNLADDLLELARKMAGYTKSDVLDARLRRAISTAYYALFHLLTEQGAARIVAHGPSQALVGRAFAHGEMVKAAMVFKSGAGGLPGHLYAPIGAAIPVPPELVRIAGAFDVLQQARHEADYDRLRSFTRADANAFVVRASQAFADWKAVSANPAHADWRELFLATLLLGERMRR